MSQQFREYHLFQFLKRFDSQSLPLDVFLNNYYKMHRALGSKDRKFLSDTIFGMIKWKGLLEYVAEKKGWEKMYHLFQEGVDEVKAPPHVKVSCPIDLFTLISSQYGPHLAEKIALINNEEAPLTIRINPLKTSREFLFTKFKEDKYEVSLCEHSPWGIFFHKRYLLSELQEFKDGLFEIQDEASQLVSDLMDVKPKEKVLDYCAGSGGKTLAFAHKMQGVGIIHLHDIRPSSLLQARTRCKRASLYHVQFHDTRAKLSNNMHWVLADVPCSGSGTYRRNPDAKWKFSKSLLKRLQEEQRKIFGEALSYLRPGGKIVYATCSILKEENEEQIEYFLKKYPLSLEKSPFKSLPCEGGMDGFFAATLTLKV